MLLHCGGGGGQRSHSLCDSVAAQKPFVCLQAAPKQALCSLLTSDMLYIASNSVVKTICNNSGRVVSAVVFRKVRASMRAVTVRRCLIRTLHSSNFYTLPSSGERDRLFPGRGRRSIRGWSLCEIIDQAGAGFPKSGQQQRLLFPVEAGQDDYIKEI